jgi:hypothetical protein
MVRMADLMAARRVPVSWVYATAASGQNATSVTAEVYRRGTVIGAHTLPEAKVKGLELVGLDDDQVAPITRVLIGREHGLGVLLPHSDCECGHLRGIPYVHAILVHDGEPLSALTEGVYLLSELRQDSGVESCCMSRGGGHICNSTEKRYEVGHTLPLGRRWPTPTVAPSSFADCVTRVKAAKAVLAWTILRPHRGPAWVGRIPAAARVRPQSSRPFPGYPGKKRPDHSRRQARVES